jgi:hypothetical protein
LILANCPRCFPNCASCAMKSPVSEADFGQIKVRLVRYCAERPDQYLHIHDARWAITRRAEILSYNHSPPQVTCGSLHFGLTDQGYCQKYVPEAATRDSRMVMPPYSHRKPPVPAYFGYAGIVHHRDLLRDRAKDLAREPLTQTTSEDPFGNKASRRSKLGLKTYHVSVGRIRSDGTACICSA